MYATTRLPEYRRTQENLRIYMLAIKYNLTIEQIELLLEDREKQP